MTKLTALFLVLAQTAWAGLPPTTIKGQNDASPKTKFAFQVPNNQATDLGGIKALIETGSDDVLANPTFQATGVSSSVVPSWTLAGAGVTAGVSTSPTFGNDPQVLQLTLSSATGDLLSQDVTPKSTASFAGINLENSMWVYAPTSGVTLQVCARLSGADVSGACVSVPNIGGWAYVPASSVGGSGSAGVSLFASASSTGTVYVTHGYVGRNRNIGTVAQAQFIGSVTVTGCAGPWNAASTGFVNFTAQTGCSYSVSGQVSAPSTLIPGFKTTSSSGPGHYVLKYIGAWTPTVSSSNTFLAWSDGTSTSQAQAFFSATASFTSPVFEASFDYTNAVASGTTFQLQGKASSGGINIYGQTGAQGTFELYYYPSQSQAVASLANVAAQYNGSLSGSGGGWGGVTGTGPGWNDFSVATTSSTLTASTAAPPINITCSAEATKLPGITCALPYTGTWTICATLPLENATAGSGTFVAMTDGSNNLLSGGTGGVFSGSNGYGSTQVCGDITLSTLTQTFKLRGQVAGGTAGILQYAAAPINWSIYPKTQQRPQPLATGNVSSTTTGQEHIERAQIGATGSACTSTPCTVTSQSGSWLTAVTRSAVGNYSISVAPNEFSAAPTCYFTSISSTAGLCSTQSPTSTTIPAFCVNSATGSGADEAFQIICMGPH